MTNEEWTKCGSATQMLVALYVEQPSYFKKSVPDLHKFLIACCWKHQHLIPQDGLRNGLKGAEDWIAGKIDYEELNRLNYYAEADAFFLDYCEKPSDLKKIKVMIGEIPELKGIPVAEARDLLKRAAYFAEGSMIYPSIRPGPWNGSLFASEFVCADLLREHLAPNLLD